MLRIGTSGFSYDHWAGVFYPPGLPAARRLQYYSERFDTVELNASFYRWPTQRAFAGWRQRLPDGFLMAVKAHRGLTHARRLAHPDTWQTRLADAQRLLGPKFAALLVQLPAAFARDDDRLGGFLAGMPRGLRVAVELRHESWQHDEVFALLERFAAGYVVISGARLPCVLRATADFVYVRLHGPDTEALYAGSYPDDDLRWWAQRIREWHGQGRDVFAYFNNDGHGYAVRNAARLKALLGGPG